MIYLKSLGEVLPQTIDTVETLEAEPKEQAEELCKTQRLRLNVKAISLTLFKRNKRRKNEKDS